MSKDRFRKIIAWWQSQITARRYMSHLQHQYTIHLNALYDLSAQLAHASATDDISQMIVELLERTVGYAYGAVLLIEPSSRKLVPVALSAQGHDQAFVEADKAYVAAHNLTVGVGITGCVAQTGQTVRLADVRQDRRYYAMREDIRAELCVPLRVDQQIIGVLNTETPDYNVYTAADQRLLETVANHLVFVILYRQQAQQVEAGAAGLAQRGLTRSVNEEISGQAVARERRLRELEAAFATTRQLQGLLVMCAACKRVRDPDDEWQPIAQYFEQHPHVTYSHGICPECFKQLYADFI